MQKPLLLIFITAFCFVSSSICFSQTLNRKPRRTRDFGRSLNQSSQKDKKESKSPEDEEIIRVESSLVVNEILVLNKQGNIVKGLKKEDFSIAEDNVSQQIATFSLGDDQSIGRSIVLIIDCSGSLLPYIEMSVDAAKTLVEQLNPDDVLAIVTDDVELLVDFTGDKILLKKQLDSLKKRALEKRPTRSLQFSALFAVLNEMFNENSSRPIVIFQTDGDELAWLKNSYMAILNSRTPFFKTTGRTFSFDDVLTAGEKSRATIYTVIPGLKLLGVSESEAAENVKKYVERFGVDVSRQPKNPDPKFKKMWDEVLKMFPNGLPDHQSEIAGMSKFTGGWTEFLEKPEQSNEIYARILSGIKSRYLIGYYSSNTAKDGKRRNMKIELPNHPEYVVWGRTTYFALESR